jgi:hypothetical protein
MGAADRAIQTILAALLEGDVGYLVPVSRRSFLMMRISCRMKSVLRNAAAPIVSANQRVPIPNLK